jgi:hypothetical protein
MLALFNEVGEKLIEVLRLREGFAPRSRHYAQDDKALKIYRQLIF